MTDHNCAQDVAGEMEERPPPPVLPKNQRGLNAELKQEKKDRKRQPENAEGDQYCMKIHKRKLKNGEMKFTYAIVRKDTNQQIVQLTQNAKADADVVIDAMVKDLNAGSITADAAVSAIDALKTSS